MPKSDIMPFKMYENLYFVGSTRVSVHLIETVEGLVLIDAGYPDMYEQIIDSIETLGFNPKDICAIFHTHGHYDHYGCTLRLVKLSGAKTYVSRIDGDVLNGKRWELSWLPEKNMPPLEFFDCDVLIEDGDVYTFGETSIRCRLTPGHTEGVMSFFITVGKGEKQIIAAMHGGVGSNSLATDYLKRYNLPFKLRDIFKEGLRDLANEHVDLTLGNHPQQNDTEGKLKKVLAGESIVDTTEWQRFLIAMEEKINKRIADGL